MMKLTFILTTLSVSYSSAFVGPSPKSSFLTSSLYSEGPKINVPKPIEEDDEPMMNPNNPNLPYLRGDYDEDVEFAEDPDWITENVPGKIVLNEIDLAAQATGLAKLEEEYRKKRLAKDYEDARIIGWVPMAETYNGRAAMFFLVVGLLTELWTGISIPGQIEEMARVGGFIGPDF